MTSIKIIKVLILLVRSTDQLKYPSYFGTICMLAGVFWMWIKCFRSDFDGISEMKPFKITFPPMIGGYTYCIVCIASLVSGKFIFKCFKIDSNFIFEMKQIIFNNN